MEFLKGGAERTGLVRTTLRKGKEQGEGRHEEGRVQGKEQDVGVRE